MSINFLARKILPKRLYQRLSASNIAKRLVKGSAWSIVGSAASRLFVLLGMILLARILGQTAFGEFGMVQTTLGVAGMMAGFGLGSTATRFVAQYVKTDLAKTGRIIGLITMSTMVLISGAGLVLVLGAGEIAQKILNAAHLKQALVWGTLLMIAMTIRGVQSGVLAGVERFDVIAKFNAFEGIASLFGLVMLAWLFGVEGGLLGLALGTFATWIVGQYTLHGALRAHGLSVIIEGCWQEKDILVGYSLPSFLANLVASPVLWYGMTLVTKRPNGYDDLALYNAAYQWHGPLIFLPMILLSVSTPVLVQQWEQGSIKLFHKIFLWNAGFMLAITVIPLFIVSLSSPWIMGLYGENFKDGKIILIFMVLAAPIHALAKMASSALLGMNRAWAVFVLNLIWGVTILVLSEFLVPTWGAKGLAVAFLAAYIVLMFITSMVVFWHLNNFKEFN